MKVFVRTPTAQIRKLASVFGGTNQRRLVLVGMASVLLLSGCMLSPLFQAPAAIMTGIAVLLGLAACGGGGGGGGGSDKVNWPAIVSLGLLKTAPTAGISFVAGDYTGFGSSIVIGDSVNGTDFNSMVIGAPDTHAYGTSYGGVAYVVFGDTKANWNEFTTGTSAFSMYAFEGNGMTIVGKTVNAYAGAAVAIAPNMNGDSNATVIVGAPDANANDGEVWAVFGLSGGGRVDLASGTYGNYMQSNGTEGVQLRDSGVGSRFLGSSLVTLDLNGDGYSDVVIGNPANYGASSAHALVLFGNMTFTNWQNDLAGAEASLKIHGGAYFYTAQSLAKGRVNGDGIDDLIVGAPKSSAARGQVSVVFGKSDTGIAYDLSHFNGTGVGGFVIFDSSSNSPVFGELVASGDVNGDGYDDIIISDRNTGDYSARVWVVFGTSSLTMGGVSTFDLGTMSSGAGFHIDLPSGTKVNSLAVGNVNGDGFADILIGSRDVQRRGYSSSGFGYNYHNGAVFVVFGSAAPVDIATSELKGTNGFVVLGSDYARIGDSVAIGDLNNDGLPDVAIGSTAYNDSHNYNGRVWVIWGLDKGSVLEGYSLPTEGDDGVIVGSPS